MNNAGARFLSFCLYAVRYFISIYDVFSINGVEKKTGSYLF